MTDPQITSWGTLVPSALLLLAARVVRRDPNARLRQLTEAITLMPEGQRGDLEAERAEEVHRVARAAPPRVRAWTLIALAAAATVIGVTFGGPGTDHAALGVLILAVPAAL